ncbi:hypothetical protein N9R81_03145 [Flavobacteriales bacterium]|nr:hypothetical protein [Flavobacteriales bacterium]
MHNRIFLITSLVFLLMALNTKAQMSEEYSIKKLAKTGLQVGGHIGNGIGIAEIGLGRILIDKPCNHSHNRAFASKCGFPKKLEIDATLEFNFMNSILYGQKLTLLYTIFAWDNTNDFNNKPFLYTIGHTFLGCSVVNYTPDFRTSNVVFLRPEVSWMAPQRLRLMHQAQSDRLEMNIRITYGYNVIDDLSKLYGMGRHQFGISCLFLYTRKHHIHYH